MPGKTPVSIASLALLLPLIAVAGGRATLEAGAAGGGDVIELTWKDENTLRMQTGSQSDYFIARDGKAYSVTMQGGQPMVMDMQAMMGAVRAMAGQQGGGAAAETPEFVKSGSFEATGKTETVAGIKGEVYRMEWEDPDGKRQVQEAVLTDDPTVVEMTRAYWGSIAAMFGGEEIDDFRNSMPGGKQGLLRVGTQFRVKSISNDTPPDSHFELPAKPMNMQDLMRGNR